MLDHITATHHPLLTFTFLFGRIFQGFKSKNVLSGSLMERGAGLKQFDRIAQIPRHFSLDQLAQLNFNVTFFLVFTFEFVYPEPKTIFSEVYIQFLVFKF